MITITYTKVLVIQTSQTFSYIGPRLFWWNHLTCANLWLITQLILEYMYIVHCCTPHNFYLVAFPTLQIKNLMDQTSRAIAKVVSIRGKNQMKRPFTQNQTNWGFRSKQITHVFWQDRDPGQIPRVDPIIVITKTMQQIKNTSQKVIVRFDSYLVVQPEHMLRLSQMGTVNKCFSNTSG